ncbi:MAG TPA: S1 RNA-binding domain-containing protein, partial [Acidimicrobiales bacterium]|nr:S1 RNA-binding domain-containing protein [Acidimicrobiales bacterium]
MTDTDMAPAHLVIDGSNIATEGRNLPSLKQLDEAVRAFLEERPHDVVTVVVDATFEHRIDSSERKMYDEALEAGELLTPPAGTIGRGDKFILEIADRAEATIFSNDSFQEFHGEYTWLFDEGRLVGGKPVPHIGWIFTERTPVRGPKSRQATRAAAKKRTRGSSGSSTKRVANATRAPKAAPRTMPDGSRPRIGDTLPTGADDIDETSETVETVETGETSETGDGGRRRRQAPDSDRTERGGGRSGRRRGGRTGSGEASSSTAADAINDPLPFIEFIADNRPGDTVEGEVVEFSSHGAYVKVGEARCYVPLKSMADPAPRSAREVLERGEVRTFVVQSLDAPRRGIDLAIPGFEEVQELADAEVEDVRAEAEAEVAQPARRRGGRRAAAPAEETSEAKAPARGRGRRAAAPVGKAAPADEQAVE